MCDLAPLSRWINAWLRSERPFARNDLQGRDAEVLDLAEHIGIIRPVGSQTRVTCTECDDPHPARIELLPDGRLAYLCLQNGWIELSAEQIALVTLDKAVLLNTLAAAAGLNQVKPKSYAEGRLALFGLVPTAARGSDWILGYADELEHENVLAGVTEALWNRTPSGPGLIATPSTVNLNMPLPRQFKLVALHELFVGEYERIFIEPAVVADRLGRQRKIPGERGRPGTLEVTREIWSAARKAVDWPSARKQQAERIRADWPSDQRPAPSPKTIENHLRELENE